MLRLLAGDSANLTVVGDDDQAIYRWRGAAAANLLAFREVYPGAREVVLVENHRSTQPILDAAARLISYNNPHRLEAIAGIDKRLRAQRPGGMPVRHAHYDTVSAEADGVAALVEQRLKAGFRPRDIAVLVRSNGDADPFLRALNVKGIPHRFSGSRGLYAREEVRLLVHFLRVLASPEDSVSLFYLAASEVYRVPEADLIRLRTREGMRVAKAKGRLRGKQPKLNPRQEAHLVTLHRAGEHSTAELGDLFGVSRSTVYRAIQRDVRQHPRRDVPGRAERARLAHQPQRDRGRDEIADHRDQSDQAVDAVADIGAGHDERDIQQLRQRIEPRHPLLAGEIGERVGGGIAEIEPEAANLRTQRLRGDFAPLLVDNRAVRLRSAKRSLRPRGGSGRVARTRPDDPGNAPVPGARSVGVSSCVIPPTREGTRWMGNKVTRITVRQQSSARSDSDQGNATSDIP
jgi:DNA-binding MarR family transcriptional regulator